jgi:hypothetical protein
VQPGRNITAGKGPSPSGLDKSPVRFWFEFKGKVIFVRDVVCVPGVIGVPAQAEKKNNDRHKNTTMLFFIIFSTYD